MKFTRQLTLPLICLGLVSSTVSAYDDCCIPECNAFIPRISYVGGSGRSYKKGYGSAEAFLTYAPCGNNYLFADARIHSVSFDEVAGNVGLGWRMLCSNFADLFGVNVYWDTRCLDSKNYQQIGVGAEVFQDGWEIRANGYIPISSKEFSGDAVFNFGSVTITQNNFRRGLGGVELEVGRHLFCGECYNLFVGVGSYGYGLQDSNRLYGGMGRVTLEFTRYLEAQLLVTQDSRYDTHVQGSIAVSLPFTCICKGWRRIYEPVRRNPIIILDQLSDFGISP